MSNMCLWWFMWTLYYCLGFIIIILVAASFFVFWQQQISTADSVAAIILSLLNPADPFLNCQIIMCPAYGELANLSSSTRPVLNWRHVWPVGTFLRFSATPSITEGLGLPASLVTISLRDIFRLLLFCYSVVFPLVSYCVNCFLILRYPFESSIQSPCVSVL